MTHANNLHSGGVFAKNCLIRLRTNSLRNRSVTFIFVTCGYHSLDAATMRRDVFQAIADPTRRAIIQILAKRSVNLNAVAENFDISRPAISRHIKILRECGLITIKQEGRERYCYARLQHLQDVSKWVDQYRRFWTAKLDHLEVFLERNPKQPVAAGKIRRKPSEKKTKIK